MDEHQGDYAEWNKSDRKRQIPFDLSYMQNLKKKKKYPSSDTENRLVFTGDGGIWCGRSGCVFFLNKLSKTLKLYVI